MIKRERKGVGHIEIVLSFIMFIFFVMGALLYFSPVKSSKAIDSYLPYSFNALTSEASVDIESYSLKLNSNLITAPTVSVKLQTINPGKKLRVENYYTGEVLPSEIKEGLVYFDWKNNNFISIKMSEDFEDSQKPSSYPPLNESLYIIGSNEVKKILSEKKILELNNSYYRDYLSLKKKFKFEGGVEFAFNLIFSPDDFIKAEKGVPANIEVFSDIKRIEVLRKGGESQFADLMIKLW